MPVVMEKRIVFELSDILKIRLECGLCGGEFSFPTNVRSLNVCPICGKDFDRDTPADYKHPQGYSDERLALENFLGNLRYFSGGNYQDRRSQDKVPWRILLELPGDPD